MEKWIIILNFGEIKFTNGQTIQLLFIADYVAMDELREKRILIFEPYLFLSVFFTFMYTALYWFLFIHLRMTSIDKGHFSLYGSSILSGILTYLLFYPKIKLLEFSNKKWGVDKPSNYFAFVWISICTMTMFAQDYIESATGQILKLNNIKELVDYEPTKYVSLEKYYIDKTRRGVSQSGSEVTYNKFKTEYEIKVCIAIPIFADSADTNLRYCDAWLCKYYYKIIDNDIDSSRKVEIANQFAKQSEWEFECSRFDDFVYLIRFDYAPYRSLEEEAVRNTPNYFPTNIDNIFRAVNEPYENKNGSSLFWFVAILILSNIIWFFMVIIPDFNEEELRKYYKNHSQTKKELDDGIEENH